MSEIDWTSDLSAFREGDKDAAQRLSQSLYPFLRDIARARMRQSGVNGTWQPTDLANEAYLKLHERGVFGKVDRNQLMAAASNVVRQVLIDYLRSRQAIKRGGLEVKVDSEAIAEVATGLDETFWLELDQAMVQLEKLDADASAVVEMVHFGGMKLEEIAESKAVSLATITRRLRFGRAFLRDRLGKPGSL
jgi:RNA polymerase sigma factor (TIGR02999 family)